MIRDAHESGDIRLYTIKVHALKSSARIIGASGLAELAEKLEEAGKLQDKTFIDENTRKRMEAYEAYNEILGRLKADDGKASGQV